MVTGCNSGFNWWWLRLGVIQDLPYYVWVSNVGDDTHGATVVFLFKETIKGEAALLLERDGGLLITCDSVQHWMPSELMSPLVKLVTPMIGFQKPAQIGPPWRKTQTPPGGSLRGDFERLLELPFERLIGGHGGLLESAAHDALAMSVEGASSNCTTSSGLTDPGDAIRTKVRMTLSGDRYRLIVQSFP